MKRSGVTGISSVFKTNSIAWRIAAGYLTVVIITGVLMSTSFWVLLSRHIENVARDNLIADSKNLTEIINSRPQSGYGKGMMMHQYMAYQMLGHVIQGEYLLINPAGMVLESSILDIEPGNQLEPSLVQKLASSYIFEGKVTLGNERYVAAARYISGQAGRGGAVLLLTKVEGLENIRRDLVLIFLASLGMALLAAVLITMLIAGRISRPLIKLKEKTMQLAERKFGGQVEVEGSGEIGELGRAINTMEHKLEQYDQIQKQFFQNASHELKSPLMSIQGYAEGVRDGVFQGQDADKALGVIVRETGRLKNLVEEFVFLGKLESPTGIYHFEEIELAEVLEQAVESQRVLALEKSVTLKFNECPDVILRADGEKMVRVFINLIANAIRHATSIVEIAVEAFVEDRVKIAVRDDGPGFTAEDLTRLWERFYKGTRGGIGLGLPIAKAIVDEHGGSIQAANLPTGGAQIEVVVPVIGCLI